LSGAVGEDLVVVLVLLIPDMELGELNRRRFGREGDWDMATPEVVQGEVLNDNRNRVGSIAPKGVSDAMETTLQVLTPFTFTKARVMT
jgi:hypothetical protein